MDIETAGIVSNCVSSRSVAEKYQNKMYTACLATFQPDSSPKEVNDTVLPCRLVIHSSSASLHKYKDLC